MIQILREYQYIFQVLVTMSNPNRNSVAAGLALLAVLAGSAAAQIVDPSTLHLGTGQGTACAQGCKGDPNMLGGASTFDLYQTSGGGGALLNQPVLLILAQPHGTAAGTVGGTAQLFLPYNAVTSTSVTVTSTLDAFGLGGYVQGSEDTALDIYTFLSTKASDPGDQALFAAGNNSNSMTNLNGAEQLRNEFTPAGYDVYVFEVETPNFGANDLLNFTGSLPNGTFAFGFGEGANGNPYVSPFTEAGLTDAPPTDAPEPASLLLLGTGLLGTGMLSRRRRGAR
jgi:PEP-CTERM motif-containing protein